MSLSLICGFMAALNMVVWNVRGLNGRARRALVSEFVQQHNVSLILDEAKCWEWTGFSVPIAGAASFVSRSRTSSVISN